MKAFVLRQGSGRFEERPLPEAGPGEVVVRTTAVSVCSADLACIAGDFPTPDGTILGHEAVGVVHQLGERVSRFRPGQRVTVASTTPCGVCANCQRGYSGHCQNTEWGGYTFGVSRDGVLAEYFTVPNADLNLVEIPDSVDDSSALCVPDTLASGSTGVEAAHLPLGGTVVVFGQGHIGLAATATARVSGAGIVISVKARPGGEDTAMAAGADHTLNLAEHDVIAEVHRLTGGAGADLAVEASGVRDSFPRAVEVTRLGGTISVLSSYSGPPGASLAIPLAAWGWGIGDKTILSTFQQPGSERLGRLLRLIETGRIDPTTFMTQSYGFTDISQALADLAAQIPGHVKPFIAL